ncbi:hypothetical protein SB861_14650 [Paraburkholderia sp. SIMBA_049]
MIGTTCDAPEDGEKSIPVSMPCLLLYAGEVMRDQTSTAEGRTNAKCVFDELLACAVSHGFGHARRLRELCAFGFYSTPEAARLARLALDHVPADRVRAAMARAGFIEGVS